jgi:hypothetical protein
MKRCLSIIFLLTIVLSLKSQVKHDVLASAGDYSINGGVSISWTLGETVIPTFQNGDVILTHGFQQQLIIATLEKNLDLQVEILIYPNPASDMLNLRFGSPTAEVMTLNLFDTRGQLVKTIIVEAPSSEKQINMQELAAGIYYLKLTKGKLSNVYKVVKL